MNHKKAGVGKTILIILGIVLLVIIIVAGITAWQVYDLYKTVQTEFVVLGGVQEAIDSQDCSKLATFEESLSKVKSKAKSACLNPIIRIVVDKMPQVSVKCSSLPDLEKQMNDSLSQVRQICPSA